MQDAQQSQTLEVTVEFAHFFLEGGCCIGPLKDAERYSVPTSRTCQELKEQIMAETKHKWDGARLSLAHREPANLHRYGIWFTQTRRQVLRGLP